MGRQQNPMRRSWLDDGGGGWIPHRLQLLVSPAWHFRPVPLRNLLERIEIEHMRHAGKENGHLLVSFDQFVAHGISRKILRPTIDLGASLGLLEVLRPAAWHGDIRPPNEYRLTYLPEKDRRAPTDEWQTLTEEGVKAIIADFQQVAAGKRKTAYQFPFQPSDSSPFGQKGQSDSSPFGQSPVPQGERSLISGR